MPSSKNYVRDYKQESKTKKARERKKRITGASGKKIKNSSAQRAARRWAIKMGMVKPGDRSKHVDHKKPISKGGTNAKSNLRVVSASKNTSYARNSDGSIKGDGRKKRGGKK